MSRAPIIYPGGQYRQLARKSTTLLAPRIINIHTMVGTLHGVENYFAKAGNPYSHFGTGHDGEVRQWQDLRYRAASDLNGNPYCISIENADKGPGFPAWSGTDVPRFTDKQADALVMLLSWLCHRFGLPREAITTSCPHERGIGYHRLGVDPYRHTGCGHLWSSARGKACPGDRRIHQLLTEIIPRVSTPTLPPEDDDMPNIICRGDRDPTIWITDGKVKTRIPSKELAGGTVFVGLAKWDSAKSDAFKVQQSWIDSIPLSVIEQRIIWFKGPDGKAHAYSLWGSIGKYIPTTDALNLLRFLGVEEGNTKASPLDKVWQDSNVLVDGPCANVASGAAVDVAAIAQAVDDKIADEEILAAIKALPAGGAPMDVQAIARAAADEADRRARERLSRE